MTFRTICQKLIKQIELVKDSISTSINQANRISRNFYKHKQQFYNTILPENSESSINIAISLFTKYALLKHALISCFLFILFSPLCEEITDH